MPMKWGWKKNVWDWDTVDGKRRIMQHLMRVHEATRNDIQQQVFHRHISQELLDQITKELVEENHIEIRKAEGGSGRPPRVYTLKG